ncbi:MAG: NAD(P)/FAD-dependent oxidoreductase [Acidimicrobiia bacterium]|nr:NAD(P)/FAD-dependent oxidoreductase [Acidimicrobiia bacterium]
MTAVRPHVIPSRRRFDAIVIGSGSGGLTVAVGLGRFGRDALLIEREHMGGDCTNTGCIPSKTLLHQTAALAAGSGADPRSILAGVRAHRDALRDHEVQEFGGADGVTFVYGSGPLNSDRSVSITRGDGTVWRAAADNVVLATGSSPRRLDVPGFDDGGGDGDGNGDRVVLTNEELFELSTPPTHLAIIGAGAIGLEMALAFRRLGSAVTVVELANQVLPGVLPEAAGIVAGALVEHGIVIRTGVRVAGYRSDGGRLELAPTSPAAANNGGSIPVDSVDRVLVAVGRVPNTSGLGLVEAGVELDDRGAVVVDGRGRTSSKGVWAVGDMTNKGGTTHDAAIRGRRIIQSIVQPYLPIGDEPLRPTVTFTDPEVASIGDQPASPPADVVRITVDGAGIDRSYTDGVDRGILVVDVRPPTGTVLGATIVGPRAGEIITTFSLAMKAGIAFHRWYGTVIPYPTYSEVITKAVQQYLSEVGSDVTGHTVRWATGLLGRTRARLSRT